MTEPQPSNATTSAKPRARPRVLDNDLKPVLVALATDQPLDAKYRDHDLSGDWAGYRECHVKPDLLLIYRKSDADTLRLARLGSHSKLFG